MNVTTFDAMLAPADGPTESTPCVERGHVLARANLGFGNALGDETLEYRRVIAHGLAGDGSRERFLSDLFGAGLYCLAVRMDG
jgi:hypothetical protein